LKLFREKATVDYSQLLSITKAIGVNLFAPVILKEMKEKM
jgi:hypothetical protein